ncbi:Protein of unknown function DUF2268, Zn-dependent protease-related protein [Allomeiothermus silvanus DSM 9946]|uniref:DUF2268 domain-containing protein n=1 Tax=Allomeiothermus silvanus (strain ATCC 700542 / DSM 9946 / NBRC 106475 / NCIMB 13440 / VI-R2) TaxID=526227 RepID=D7BBQ0_ALLS1|nr:DUF2268 domain-containing putative Zn-dependent protease [Allomeiothermus silvanus]ADH64512.1 Protein of unknown function DUF2268, Zn-dependent protease-related protein [Allomeiothermus silvanus DSM 9946]
MPIIPINALAGQRAALQAPVGSRLEVFRERVIEPLSDFWKPFLHRMPPTDPGVDPALAIARAWGFYSPEDDIEAGLEALRVFEREGTWPACVAAIEKALQTLDPAAHGIELEPVRFTLLLGSLRILRLEYGAYTGAQQPGFALVMGWPNPVGSPRLPVAAAHELNHIVRFKYEPWTPQTTVGQYMVAEGLAEAFGVEVVGDASLVGPYSAALTPEQIEAVKPRFQEALETTGFDTLRGYIFGDWAAEQFGYPKQGMPDYAGYTLGYQVVRAYLKRTGRTAAEATYTSWREIVQESGYFG